MKPQEMITSHEVMTCPVCGERITATVHVMPRLGEPTVTTEHGGDVVVPVTAEMTRFHVTHHCGGRVLAINAEKSA